MKLTLLDVNKFTRGLTPVTSTELKTRSGEFNPDGLFSEKIFGVEITEIARELQNRYHRLTKKRFRPY